MNQRWSLLVTVLVLTARFCCREIVLCWNFVWRDLTTTMIPALFFLLAANNQISPISISDFLILILKWAIYFWLYVYSFCLADQIAGTDEDRINKPDRPIPSGQVTLEGAMLRLGIIICLFLGAGIWLQVWPWTILWIFSSILHNFGGWDKHWFTKNNVIMPLGFLAEVGAAWEIVTPLTAPAWRWLIVGAIVVAATAPVQDFRDVAGDRLTQRRTLPIVLGDQTARFVVCALFVAMQLLIHAALMPQPGNAWSLACEIWLCALVLVIIYRLLRYRNPHEDHKTYMIYTYWYTSILASALVIL